LYQYLTNPINFYNNVAGETALAPHSPQTSRARSIKPMSEHPTPFASPDPGAASSHDHGGHGQAVLEPLGSQGKALRALIPEVYRGFAQMSRAAMADGALDARTKELVALAVSVATKCDGCIAAHAKGAARQGASREQAAEAIGVALFLSGGPGTVYGPRAFDAFCEFTEPERPDGAA
jgi:AhpD family alkylhydroperoxidase